MEHEIELMIELMDAGIFDPEQGMLCEFNFDQDDLDEE